MVGTAATITDGVIAAVAGRPYDIGCRMEMSLFVADAADDNQLGSKRMAPPEGGAIRFAKERG
jgi:hypothetical protein